MISLTIQPTKYCLPIGVKRNKMKKYDFDSVGLLEYVKQKLGDNLIVAEIGVYKGEYAQSINDILVPKEYHMVDTWGKHLQTYKDYPQMKKNNGWENLYSEICSKFNKDNIKIHRMMSSEGVKLFPDGYFDFVYIDADHSYETAKFDIIEWEKKVKKGGILAGHDWLVRSVRRALTELRGDDYNLTREMMKSWFWEV